MTPGKANQEGLGGVLLGVILKEQLEAGIKNHRAENIGDPVEAVEQGHTRRNEDATHDDRAEDAPQQRLALELLRNLEDAEDQQEEEKIVDAERLLDEIGGGELQGETAVRDCAARHLLAVEVDQDAEAGGHSHPEHGPEQGRAQAHGLSLALQEPQIQPEHENDENKEKDPEQQIVGTVHAGFPSPPMAPTSLTFHAHHVAVARPTSANNGGAHSKPAVGLLGYRCGAPQFSYRVFSARTVSIVTSPMICRLWALHLSAVSSVVW